MALENPAYVISSEDHGAQLFRLAAQSMLGSTGVVSYPLDLAVLQHGAGAMSVDVNPGGVWIPGTLGSAAGMGFNYSGQTPYGAPSTFTTQGAYYAYQDGTVTLTIATANPSNPRIDLICASIEDAEYAGSSNTPVLSVVTGTAAPSPSAPAPPDAALVLASILVPASATAIMTGNITDVRPPASPSTSGVGLNAAFQSFVSVPTCGPTPTQFDYYEPGISFENECVATWIGGVLLYSDVGHTTPVGGDLKVSAVPGTGINIQHSHITFQNFTGDTIYPLINVQARGF